MKLEELARMDRRVRQLLSSNLPDNLEYRNSIDKGYRFFTASELADIERDKKSLTYKEINEILSKKGMIVKMATFKKYVNLNLISSSIGRVNKSSVGLYPPTIIREINFIKYTLFSNLDLKTIDKTFGTNAYDMIINVWGADPILLLDNFIEPTADGETHPDKLKKMISKLYEEKIITIKQRNEITKISDKIVDLANERYKTGNKLQEILEKIEIPNTEAFSVLGWLDNAPKDDNKKLRSNTGVKKSTF